MNSLCRLSFAFLLFFEMDQIQPKLWVIIIFIFLSLHSKPPFPGFADVLRQRGSVSYTAVVLSHHTKALKRCSRPHNSLHGVPGLESTRTEWNYFLYEGHVSVRIGGKSCRFAQIILKRTVFSTCVNKMLICTPMTQLRCKPWTQIPALYVSFKCSSIQDEL